MPTSDLTPDTEPPFFWRRVYTEADLDEVILVSRTRDGRILIQTDMPEALVPEEIRANAEIQNLAPDGLVIYGRAIWPDSEHDRQVIEQVYRPRGQVFSQCFSERCIDGEVGTHPAMALTEISRSEFEAARAKGWKA